MSGDLGEQATHINILGPAPGIPSTSYFPTRPTLAKCGIVTHQFRESVFANWLQ